ncbi:MAG: hypothetical protein Tsb005_03120 [Gammaproteobacteria bacterium]
MQNFNYINNAEDSYAWSFFYNGMEIANQQDDIKEFSRIFSEDLTSTNYFLQNLTSEKFHSQNQDSALTSLIDNDDYDLQESILEENKNSSALTSVLEDNIAFVSDANVNSLNNFSTNNLFIQPNNSLLKEAVQADFLATNSANLDENIISTEITESFLNNSNNIFINNSLRSNISSSQSPNDSDNGNTSVPNDDNPPIYEPPNSGNDDNSSDHLTNLLDINLSLDSILELNIGVDNNFINSTSNNLNLTVDASLTLDNINTTLNNIYSSADNITDNLISQLSNTTDSIFNLINSTILTENLAVVDTITSALDLVTDATLSIGDITDTIFNVAETVANSLFENNASVIELIELTTQTEPLALVGDIGLSDVDNIAIFLDTPTLDVSAALVTEEITDNLHSTLEDVATNVLETTSSMDNLIHPNNTLHLIDETLSSNVESLEEILNLSNAEIQTDLTLDNIINNTSNIVDNDATSNILDAITLPNDLSISTASLDLANTVDNITSTLTDNNALDTILDSTVPVTNHIENVLDSFDSNLTEDSTDLNLLNLDINVDNLPLATDLNLELDLIPDSSTESTDTNFPFAIDLDVMDTELLNINPNNSSANQEDSLDINTSDNVQTDTQEYLIDVTFLLNEENDSNSILDNSWTDIIVADDNNTLLDVNQVWENSVLDTVDAVFNQVSTDTNVEIDNSSSNNLLSIDESASLFSDLSQKLSIGFF